MSSYDKDTRSNLFRPEDLTSIAGSRNDVTWVLENLQAQGAANAPAQVTNPLSQPINPPLQGAIIVRFLTPEEGNAELRQKIRQYAELWNPHSGLKFQFIEEGAAHVRVAINHGDQGSASDLGLQCLQNQNQNTHTMHLKLPDWTSEADIRGTTLHEFGHVLGFVHEHQTALANITWDVDSLKAMTGLGDFELDANYTHVEENVTHIAYDANSIMHYQLFEGTAGNNANGTPRFTEKPTSLSPGDIQAVGALYPIPPPLAAN